MPVHKDLKRKIENAGIDLTNSKTLIKNIKDLKEGVKSKVEEWLKEVSEKEADAKKQVKNHYFTLRLAMEELEREIL